MATLKELLLAQAEQPVERAPVMLLGQTFYVREMSAAERDDYEAAQVEANKEGEALVNFRSRFLVRVLTNEDGSRALADDDAELLGKSGARAIKAAFDVAAKLNALYPDDVAELRKK